MDASEVKTLLRELGACTEAVKWAHGKTLAEIWATCDRADWMLWLCGRMVGKEGWPDRKALVLAACDCAATTLPVFEKKYPDDKRPRTAIETARKWAHGEATLEEIRADATAVSRKWQT